MKNFFQTIKLHGFCKTVDYNSGIDEIYVRGGGIESFPDQRYAWRKDTVLTISHVLDYMFIRMKVKMMFS